MSRCSSTFADKRLRTARGLKSCGQGDTARLRSPSRRRSHQLAASDGKLKEPILLVAGLLRALNAATDGDSLNNYTSNMKEDLYNSTSVFNYFPPNYQLVSNTCSPLR